MALLRTSYMYGGFLEYCFILQFSAFWSMHDKTSSWENANFKMYPSPKNWITSRKKLPPPPPATNWKISNTWQITQVTGNILIPRETLSFWKNISLPPPAIKKKISTTLKLPQPLWKSLKPPTWKFSISQRNPNFTGKVVKSFEVTRPNKPSPHEKIPIPENLTPFRKLQSSHAHENRN